MSAGGGAPFAPAVGRMACIALVSVAVETPSYAASAPRFRCGGRPAGGVPGRA
ncbi:MAG: hypothetical protein QOJ21_2183, partial [Solirubrobacteraceae bacterium]|nr:hypothetical protein [Solirubrobacteraceae bacterium]